jgi:hypothetical protein
MKQNSRQTFLTAFLFLLHGFSFGQKFNVSGHVGIIHNTIFVKPKLVLDTTFTLFGGPSTQAFPSTGYSFGSDIEYHFPNSEFSSKLGVDFDHFTAITKRDTVSARYLQQYFSNPLVESNLTLNSLSIPIYITYTYKNLSIDAGANLPLFIWVNEQQTLLDGQTIQGSTLNSDVTKPAFVTKLHVIILDKLSCSIGFSPKYAQTVNSSMVYFGFKYSFIQF